MTQPTPLAAQILQALAEVPEPAGVSLPRLGKRLGQSASVLMRELSRMGDAVIGGVPGPGWVRVLQTQAGWIAHVTAAGRMLADEMRAPRAHSQDAV